MQTPSRFGRITNLRPNWRSPVSVDYEYRTWLFRSRDGSEQRQATRENPRASVTFLANVTHDGIARFRSDYSEGTDVPVILPLRWRSFRLSQDIDAGSTGAWFEGSAPFWLVVGVEVVLSSGTKEAVVQVSGTASGRFFFAEPVETSFRAGDSVFFAYKVRLAADQAFRALSSDVWEASVSLDSVPGVTREVIAGAPFPTVAGLEVFDALPNWGTAPQISTSNEMDILDPGRGRDFVVTPERAPVSTTRYTFSALSSEKAERLIGFFHRMKGRRGAFWCPDWHSRPYRLLAVDEGSVTVEGLDAGGFLSRSPAHRGVYAAGAVSPISAVETDLFNTILSFDTTGTGLKPGDRLRLAAVSRFASDRLEVRWLTGSIAEAVFAVQTILDGA